MNAISALRTLSGLALVSSVLPSQANIIQNGSFETGAIPPPTQSFVSLFAGDQTIDSWQVTAGRVDWSGEPYTPKDGSMAAQLVDFGTTISQTLATIPGHAYTITFSLEPNQEVANPTTIQVTLGSSIYDAVLPTGALGRNWYEFSGLLTADSPLSLLTFQNIDPESSNITKPGPFLDAIALDLTAPANLVRDSARGALPMALAGLFLLRRFSRSARGT